MFLFEAMILIFMPDERIGLLIFGVALILLAVGLRRGMKPGGKSEKGANNEIQHITQ
jgi:hypothetical protein